MAVKRVDTVLRPRTHWEAIDLGFAMVHRWWRPIYLAWSVMLGLIAVILGPIWWWRPEAAWALLWFIKPLLGRVPLSILSRALFGATPTWRETLSALPSTMGYQALAAVTYQRFDPHRSFFMPVVLLERLTGEKRRARNRVLDRNESGAGWLTLLSVVFEWVLIVGLLISILSIFPELAWHLDYLMFTNPENTLLWSSLSLAAFFAIAIIEPFYVAGGFALYLNRRTILEAWDLEIAFRQMAQRLATVGKTQAPILLASTLALGATLAPAPPASAQQDAEDTKLYISTFCQQLLERNEDLENASSTAKQYLSEIYQTDDFPACTQTTSWRLFQEQKSDTSKLFNIAPALEPMIWILGTIAIGALIYWASQQRLSSPSPARRPHATNERSVERLPERFRALPVDPNAGHNAMKLWEQYRHREAIALLYRSTLVALAERYKIRFDRSDSESQCLATTARLLANDDPRQAYFNELTGIWTSFAYAHRQPPDTAVASLCDQWQQLFAGNQ